MLTMCCVEVDAEVTGSIAGSRGYEIVVAAVEHTRETTRVVAIENLNLRPAFARSSENK